jgi:tripartite-type tricarboxylate transporter receptor subunit TctC
VVTAAAATALGAAARVFAQNRYPARPITVIVPFAPGGIADLTARSVAAAMARDLGQPVVVDNRPSAGGIVGTTAVAHAAGDGYTLLLLSNANAISAGLFRKLPYDTLKDLAPVSTLGFFDLAILVRADSRLDSLQAFVEQARKRPGRLAVGTIAPGSTQNLAAELFKTVAGADVLVVPYKGTPAVLTALRAGEIDVAFEILGPMLPQIAAGAVRALAVTSEQRNPAAPNVPTAREAGVTGYAVASWNALAAPAATPADVIARLAGAARAAIADATVARRLVDLGVRPRAGTPAELRRLLATEIERWGGVIRRAGIVAQ